MYNIIDDRFFENRDGSGFNVGLPPIITAYFTYQYLRAPREPVSHRKVTAERLIIEGYDDDGIVYHVMYHRPHKRFI